MTRRTLAALVVLNVVLLLGLLTVVWAPKPAEAQVAIRRGAVRYAMLSGRVRNQDHQNLVYIVELNTMRVLPLMFNGNTKQFEDFRAMELLPLVQAR